MRSTSRRKANGSGFKPRCVQTHVVLPGHLRLPQMGLQQSPNSFTGDFPTRDIIFFFLREAFGFGVPLGAPPATAEYYFSQSLEAKPSVLSSAPPSEHLALGRSPFSLLPLHQGYLLKYVCVNEVVWLMDTNRYCFFDLQNEFPHDWLKRTYSNAH